MTDVEGLAPGNPGVIRGLHEMSESRNPLRDPRDRRIPRVAGPCVLVMFGVTGDLARKKLMPAIYDLANRGLLPPGFSLVGFARRDWEHEDFAQVTHDKYFLVIETTDPKYAEQATIKMLEEAGSNHIEVVEE